MTNGKLADRLIDWSFALIAIAACLLTLYPIVYILAVSFSSSTEIVNNNITFFPKGTTLAAYFKVLDMENVRNGIVNSLLYTSVGTVINLVLTTALAYALSRKRLIARKLMMLLVTIPLFFNGGMIPTYIVIFKLGLKDSMWAVILPWAVLSFYLILMKAFFEDIPEEIIESAAIDGANDFMVFIRIILPMSTTIIASIGLFYAIDNWNNFTNALLYLYKPEKFPLALVLRNLLVAEGEMAQSNNSAEEFVAREAIQSATIILSMIPIMLVYPFLQKYFAKGIAMGALKG
ncbi:carbohydrate ABC transporter permease [Paenibacillus koleovorans]|uniref:carbohydrate ABC transporter permease n=1 Tax=Paenibacillus koleovorans TaxID=121608 RepID=UPI000FD9CDF4|nr:carbohydrate ABC transporter permease [Paenibacillus koleovorans]